MKSKLFIFQLSCLFLSNFNYSTEEVTKSATKQILINVGTTIVATTIWANKDTLIKGGIWLTEAAANQWSHKKTQNKVDRTHDLLTKIQPEISQGFDGLKGILNKTTEDVRAIKPYIEEMTEDVRIIKPCIEKIQDKVDTIDITTKAIAATINNDNQTTHQKIDLLLNKADKNVNDYLSPIKETTEKTFRLSQQIDQRTISMNTKLDRILEQINKK